MQYFLLWERSGILKLCSVTNSAKHMRNFFFFLIHFLSQYIDISPMIGMLGNKKSGLNQTTIKHKKILVNYFLLSALTATFIHIMLYVNWLLGKTFLTIGSLRHPSFWTLQYKFCFPIAQNEFKIICKIVENNLN